MKVYKIVLTGDEAVGKTALIHKFLEEEKDIIDYKPTLGVEIHKKAFKDENTNQEMVLYLWDMAGQEKFTDTRLLYYEGADGVLLIFDCTRLRTFKNMRKWYDEAVKSCEKSIPMLLISNKQDLKEFMRVNPDETEKLAKELNIKFVETSALTGKNVAKMFVDLITKN